MDDLHDGDVALPPDADPAGSLEVVPVHHDVNHEVENDRNPGDRRVTEELSEAEECGRAVVIGVEEGQWLLFEEQEDGVDELKVFREVVHLRGKSALCSHTHPWDLAQYIHNTE